MSATVKERQKIEKHIVGKFVDSALRMGYSLTVSLERGYNHDDPDTCVLASLDRKAIMDMAFAGDECHIFVHCVGVPPVSDGALNAVGWIHCVFGNDGYDVIANRIINSQMDALMVDTEKLMVIETPRSKFSLNTRIKVQREIQSQMRMQFKNAARFCWNQKVLLRQRNDEFFSGERWDRLTQGIKDFLTGYWDALYDTLWDTLECRYLIDGKWYAPQEVGKDRNPDGPDYSQANSDNRHYVYAVNTPNGPEYKLFH